MNEQPSARGERIRNFTPAITNMAPHILAVAAKQPSYFRTERFKSLLEQAEQRMLKLIGCERGRIAFLTCSGTGAMDAAVANLIEHGERVMVINGGSFAKRWCEICAFYDLECYNYDVGFAKDLDRLHFSKAFESFRPDSVLMQATETSSMQRFPVREVGALCRDRGVKLIVDAITAFAIDNYHMDDFNITASVISSQKGLQLSPGLAMIALKEGQPIIKKPRSFYFNLNHYLQDYADMVLPFTPNLIALEQLSIRLAEMEIAGIDACVQEIAERAADFRGLISNLPLSMIPESPSNCGSLLSTRRRDVKGFFVAMQKKNLYFTPSGGEAGKRFCIGHLGNITHEDHLFLLEELRRWLA